MCIRDRWCTVKKIEWWKMKKSGFIEGTVIATAAIVITKILGMLYVIPFYAMIGIQGSALYAYAYNIYVIFLDISSAGLPVAISKIIKEYNTLGCLLYTSCERCGSTVIRKKMSQWFFKITEYAEELLQDLDKLDWPEKTKILQRNWIGKSNGAYVDFKVKDHEESFTVFTTRADTCLLYTSITNKKWYGGLSPLSSFIQWKDSSIMGYSKSVAIL